MKKKYYVLILIGAGFLIQTSMVWAFDHEGNQRNTSSFNAHRAMQGNAYNTEAYRPMHGQNHDNRRQGPQVQHYQPYHQELWQRAHGNMKKFRTRLAYKRVWNPGHYNRMGHWMPGRWVNMKIHPGKR